MDSDLSRKLSLIATSPKSPRLQQLETSQKRLSVNAGNPPPPQSNRLSAYNSPFEASLARRVSQRGPPSHVPTLEDPKERMNKNKTFAV